MVLRIALALLLALAPVAWARLGSGPGSGITPSVVITGISTSPNPCAGTSSDPAGASLCNMTATTSTGQTLNNPVFTMVNAAGTGATITGSTLQVGATPLVVGTYNLTVSVTGSNCTGCVPAPQYTVPLSVTSTVSITGISTTPSSVTTIAGTVTGTTIATMAPTATGGALTGVNIACANCLSNEFQVSGSNPFNLQVGSAGVTAGNPTPTFTVTATNATNSPQTYGVPVSVGSPAINLVSPVTCTAIATGCNGTVGDVQGTSLGTLVPTQSGGSAGTITCSTTMPNNAGGRFQITSGCVLQAGGTPYTAGSYAVTAAFSGSTASANPYNLSFTATVNPSGSVSLVQKRVLTNAAATTSPANSWIPIGQGFAPGQIPAGDGVIWKTGGGTTMTSQADDYTFWPDGSLRFAAFNVKYPNALTTKAQDIIGAYDSPGAGFNNTCFNASPSSLITAKDIRLEATFANSFFQATISGGVMTVTGSVAGTIANGATLYTIGSVAIPAGVTITSFGTGTGGTGTYNISNNTLTISSSQWVGAGSTTWTLGANNEFTNEPTKPILYRTGQSVCGYYIPGELRNGTTFASPAQGVAWGDLYIEVRSDGTYKVWGQVFTCRPLSNAGTALTGAACNPAGTTGFAPTQMVVPDANGDAFSIKDYSLGTPILMGCANVISSTVGGCVTAGHATGGAFGTYTGYVLNTVSSDAFPYDSQTDAHMLLPAWPLIVSSDPTTRGVYDAVLLPNIGYTTASIASAATNHVNPASGPNACLASPAFCNMNQTGPSAFIGLVDSDVAQCYLAGQVASNGWQSCNNTRRFALVLGSLGMSFRDAATGLQVNQAPHLTPGAPMRSANQFICGPNISTLLCSGAQAHTPGINHDPDFGYGAYILYGERPFLDLLVDQVGYDIGFQNPGLRNPTVNGHAYDAIAQFTGATRQSAWIERDFNNAWWMTPDKLADQTTANPTKTYLAWVDTGPNGDLAYYNQWVTAPHYTSGQVALGQLKPPAFDGLPGGAFAHQDGWEDSYMAVVWYQAAARGAFSSTNCVATFSGNGTASCPIFTEFFHKHYLGMGVNGCIANAAANYNYSLTDAAHAYAKDTTSTTMGQVWTDIMIGGAEGPVLGGSASTMNGAPLAGQAPGSSIDVAYPSPLTFPIVGASPQFFMGGGAFGLTMAGVSIANNTFITSVTPLTGPACTSGTCYTLGLSLPLTGTNPVPTTNLISIWSWAGQVPTPTATQPFSVTSQCPTQNLNTAFTPANANTYSIWYYDGGVWADRLGDPYGAVIRNYYENFGGSPQPGGVFPGGQTASPGCAGSFQTSLNVGLPTESSWGGQPQWRMWPIGAPQIDAAGKTTGCN